MTTIQSLSKFGRMLSVGTIRFEDRFCASKKGGTRGGGWRHPEGDTTWWLWQLAVEKPWSMSGEPLFCPLPQSGLEYTPFAL